jgi:hypothetical protein
MSSVVLPQRQTRFSPLACYAALGIVAIVTAHAAPIIWDDSPPTKVACTGASITWGYWDDLIIAEKVYPDQLRRLLGPGYTLRNYGVSSTTAGRYLNHEHRAYYHTGEHLGCVHWRPDIVIGGLGINDCTATFADPALYEQGYRELVAAWRLPGQDPKIWLWNRLTPDFRGPLGVPAYPGNIFGPKWVFGTDDMGMAANRPAIESRLDGFAPDLGVGTINVYSQLAIHPQWGGDGLHLIEPGLKRLGELVFCQAWESLSKSRTPVLSEVCPTPGGDSPRDETNTRYPWVELYNPHPHGVCLDGLAIDKGAGTTRFVFADSTVMFPGERRIVFLSGKGLTQPTKPIHANFSANGNESQIRLISRTGGLLDAMGWRNWFVTGSLGRAEAPVTHAVQTTTAHRRLVTSTPPEGWMLPAFDDSEWTQGAGGTGYELAARAESQFAMRWDCNTVSSPFWQASNAAGTWTSGGGTLEAEGPGPAASLKGGQWIQGADGSWTAELRLKLKSPASGNNDGFTIRGGTQQVGGGYAYLWIEPGRVLYGNLRSIAKVLSTEPNDDAYHVFRLAYHAPTRRFFVWRDGIEITSREGGLKKDTSRFNWLTIGAVYGTQNVAASLDYISVDKSGAFAPSSLNVHAPVADAGALPLTSDPTATEPANGSSTCLVRIPFQNAAGTLRGLKLDLEFDDGFRAWINGVPVAECNAPAADLAAPLQRDDSRSIDAVSLNLSEFIPVLVPGENVLAIQAYNSNINDGRCFIRAALDLVGAPEETGRYYSPVTANLANGAGAVLPAQGWLLQSDPPPAGSVLLTLDSDTDGDGRSNLLEHYQGTNPVSPDSPGFDIEPTLISFKWRNNPEVGWRLMESADGSVWRPARTTGPASASPSATPGMLDVSQPVLTTSGLTFALAAVEQPALETWQQRHFSASEISAGILIHPDADPDGDGAPNFLEFAIASNPRSGAQELYSTAPGQTAIRIADVGTGRGALWFLEKSGDLVQWVGIPHPEIRCLVEKPTGRYRLEVSLPQQQAGEFIRAKFLRN